MNDILNKLRGSNMDITEFDKEKWTIVFKSLIKEQHLTHDYLREILECSEKTLGYYLNPKRPELPKLKTFTRLFQYLNTSPGYMLIQKGPRVIDPASSEKLFEMMDKITDVNHPALRVCIQYLLAVEEDELRQLNRLLAAFLSFDDSYRKKVLSSLLNLLPNT